MRQDVSGRPLEMRDLDLSLLFRPRVVAVIGASETEGRQSTAQWRRMRDWCAENSARVWPVHPTKPSIDGHPAVATVLDIPDEVDLAIILIQDVQSVVEQAIAKGVRFVIAFASGFAEVGGDGTERQRKLAELVKPSSLRLLGPNTNFNAFERFRDDLPGPKLALITQSGHQGRPLFQAQDLGIAVGAWAPTGNEVDLEFADFVRWFADDPGLGVITAYIESFRDGRTLRLAADHALRAGVPVALVKVGRTPAGASMALSHTGKLTGVDTVVDAALRQHGVVRVDTLDQLIDTSQVLARHPNGPVSDGVVVYSISGGTGAHMSDLCAQAGLRLPTLSVETQRRLREWIPSYLRVSNPVDSGGNGAGDDRGRQILQTIAADPEVGVVICPITGTFAPMSDRLAQDLVELAESTSKLVCVVWGSPAGDEDAYRKTLLGSPALMTFRTFDNCVSAVEAWMNWHAFRAGYVSPFPAAPSERSAAFIGAREALSDAESLNTEHQAKRVLAAYGIPVTSEQLVASADDAVAAARSLDSGVGVVMKVSGGGHRHKSDVGGVRIGVSEDDAVRTTFAELAKLGDGQVLVCERVDDAVAELIAGVSHDEVFGPVVTLGSGGVDAEVWADIAIRIPPFDRDEVRRMLDELRGVALLRGARGRPMADEDAVIDVVMVLQRLALELEHEVRELDINPLMVRACGAGVVAADALIVPA